MKKVVTRDFHMFVGEVRCRVSMRCAVYVALWCAVVSLLAWLICCDASCFEELYFGVNIDYSLRTVQ